MCPCQSPPPSPSPSPSQSSLPSTTITMEHKNELLLATFYNVIIFKIGEKGAKHKYEPSKLSIYTDRVLSHKGWFVARNLAGNSLNVNAYIPGNCPVLLKELHREIYFGKVPSLSCVNEAGKPIPTMWTFKMGSRADMESVYGFLTMFGKLAATVNELSPPTTIAMKPRRRLQATSPAESSSSTSVNLLETSNDDLDDDEDETWWTKEGKENNSNENKNNKKNEKKTTRWTSALCPTQWKSPAVLLLLRAKIFWQGSETTWRKKDAVKKSQARDRLKKKTVFFSAPFLKIQAAPFLQKAKTFYLAATTKRISILIASAHFRMTTRTTNLFSKLKLREE